MKRCRGFSRRRAAAKLEERGLLKSSEVEDTRDGKEASHSLNLKRIAVSLSVDGEVDAGKHFEKYEHAFSCDRMAGC